MSEWFVINDLDEFTDRARTIVYHNFGTWDEDKSEIDIIIDSIKDDERSEFDKVLSHDESLVIVKENVKVEKNKQTRKIRYILDDKIFVEIISSLNDRMVSNILNNLVKKGLVESAFDDEANDFIFWVKDNTNNEEKPETD